MFSFLVFSQLLLLTFINGYQTQSFATNNNIQRPNDPLINELLFEPNNNPLIARPQNSPYDARPQTSPYDARYERNRFRPFNAFNDNSNPDTKRLIPIGGFPPHGHRHGYGQYGPGPGVGMDGLSNHHFHSPHQMLSHLMPHTFNLINSLRATLNAGIPSYGFGYGMINHPNNGFPFSIPFRTSSSESDDMDNNEKLSTSASSPTSHSTHKKSRNF